MVESQKRMLYKNSYFMFRRGPKYLKAISRTTHGSNDAHHDTHESAAARVLSPKELLDREEG